jgi:hypothetical protein
LMGMDQRMETEEERWDVRSNAANAIRGSGDVGTRRVRELPVSVH